MKVEYLRGKRSKNRFMPFGTINSPYSFSYNTIRFCRRENSLKAVVRQVRKLGLEKGTVVYVENWYIGYAGIKIHI